MQGSQPFSLQNSILQQNWKCIFLWNISFPQSLTRETAPTTKKSSVWFNCFTNWGEFQAPFQPCHWCCKSRSQRETPLQVSSKMLPWDLFPSLILNGWRVTGNAKKRILAIVLRQALFWQLQNKFSLTINSSNYQEYALSLLKMYCCSASLLMSRHFSILTDQASEKWKGFYRHKMWKKTKLTSSAGLFFQMYIAKEL